MGVFQTFLKRDNVNTGTSGYTYNPDIAIGGLLAPIGNSRLTAEQLKDPWKAINDNLHHVDPLKRWQIVGPYEDMEDMSEDAQVQTMGYGRKIVTNRGYQGVKFPFYEGGKDKANKLIKLNGMHELFRYYEIDNSNQLVGTEVFNETTNAREMDGISINMLFTHDMKRPTRSTVAVYAISFGFSEPAELNEKAYVVKLPDTSRFRKLEGVKDLGLENGTQVGAAHGVFTVYVTEGSGNANLAANATLSAILANINRWTVKRTDTGAAIPITSVAVNGTKTGFDITCNTADANYVNLKEAFIDVVDVAALAAAGMKWFANPNSEAVKVVLTK